MAHYGLQCHDGDELAGGPGVGGAGCKGAAVLVLMLVDMHRGARGTAAQRLDAGSIAVVE